MDEMYRHSQARGLIPLSVGYPSSELFPFDQMRRAMSEALDSHDSRALQYTDIAGLPEMVEQVAAFSAARGAPEEPGSILVTTGARQGLTLAARAVLRPGDVAACESPSFMGVLESLQDAGARVLPVPVDERGLDTVLSRSWSGVRRSGCSRSSRAATTPPDPISGRAPHPPAGAGASPRLLHPRGRHLRGPALRGDDPGSLRREAHGHVIYVDSLSKIVGGGLRVGWVMSSGPVRDRLLHEKRADDMHSATLTQLALARFLAAGEYPAHLERARAFYL